MATCEALSRGRNFVEEGHDLDQSIKDRLDQDLVEELLLVEITYLVEGKQAQVKKLAELLARMHWEYMAGGIDGLVDELHEETDPFGVLQQVDALCEDEAEYCAAAQGVWRSRRPSVPTRL